MSGKRRLAIRRGDLSSSLADELGMPSKLYSRDVGDDDYGVSREGQKKL